MAHPDGAPVEPAARARWPWIGLLAWLLAASAFTAAGGLLALPAPFPQALLGGLTLLLLVAYAAVLPFRRWLDALPTSAFLVLHLSRFVGVYFLVLYRRGELPWDFAVPGGWGDIAVAALALALLVAYRASPPLRSLPFQLWNALGLVDILFVVATAARLILAEPTSMAALTVLPLGLLPTFLVPAIIFTHVVVIWRGLRGGA